MAYGAGISFLFGGQLIGNECQHGENRGAKPGDHGEDLIRIGGDPEAGEDQDECGACADQAENFPDRHKKSPFANRIWDARGQSEYFYGIGIPEKSQ